MYRPVQLIATLLTLSALFWTPLALKCGSGCLACDVTGKCQLCDSANFYTLSNNKCVAVGSQANCTLIDGSGKCIECVNNYYVDSGTQKCVAVSTSYRVQNCVSYDSTQNCVACKPGFYMDTTGCADSGISLSNCSVQTDDTTCVECASGFIMTSDQTECVAPPTTISNCAAYSFVTCSGCNDNYIMDKNKYIKDIVGSLSDSTQFDDMNSLLDRLDDKDINPGLVSTCQQITVENCDSPVSPTQCETCTNGYFLTDDSTCAPYPVSAIDNCDVYTNAKSCYKCEVGYFPGTNGICKEVTPVDHCKDYSQTQNVSTCTNCEDGYFLDGVKCTGRSNTVGGCKTYDTDSDTCSTCNDQLWPTDDGIKCLAYVQGCVTYVASDKTTTTLVCKNCGDLFYLNSNKCISAKDSDPNCIKFKTGVAECQTCSNGYYVGQDLNKQVKCLPHDKNDNCYLFDQAIKNKCIGCSETNLGFTIVNKCSLANSQTGCIAYSNKFNCAQCDIGYILANSQCTQIPDSMNCLVASSLDVCTKCKPNYVLFNNQCLVPPSYLLNNCDVSNINTAQQTAKTAACTTCATSSVPRNFNNEFICLDNDWLARLRMGPIDNCAQYNVTDADPKNAKCSQCNAGFFLSGNTCVATCDAGVPIVLSNAVTNTDSTYSIASGPFCQTATFTTKISNCVVYAPANNYGSGDVNEKPICVQCDRGYGKEIYPTSPNSTGMEGANIIDNLQYKFSSPVTFLPKVMSCVNLLTSAVAADGSFVPNSFFVEDCEYYYKIDNTPKYGCLKCVNGKRGLLANYPAVNGNTTPTAAFIQSCSTTTCSSTFVPGLPAQLNSYVSCYKCTDALSIPFIFVQAGTTFNDITGLLSYNLSDANANWDNTISGGYSTGCYPRNGSAFTNVTSLVLPTNCSLGVFNVQNATASASGANQTNLSTLANLAVFCAACNPGYAPIYAKKSDGSTLKYVIYQCKPIDYCFTSSWYNYCSQCNAGYAFLYTTNGVNYSSCVKSTDDANCLARTASPTDTCSLCKKGYTLNANNICEALPVPYCQDGQFDPYKKFNRSDFNTMFALNPYGRGCLKCKTGYTPAMVSFTTNICVYSSYLLKADTSEHVNNFVTNCRKYTNATSGNPLCDTCEVGYVKGTNSDICYVDDLLPNCVVATSIKKCLTCVNNYVPIDGNCLKNNIDHCVSIGLNDKGTQQICLQCDTGYYFDGTVCTQGAVLKCAVHNTATNCKTCMTGYILTKNSAGSSYCLPSPSSLNCDVFDLVQLAANKFKCNTCSSGSYVDVLDDTDTVYSCFPINEIGGCNDYNNTSSISSSLLTCASCGDEYYSSDGACTLRENNDPNCTTNQTDDDVCETCNPGYYQASPLCLPNPSGVTNCAVYSNTTTCVTCVNKYYLKSNACVAVAPSKLVNDCVRYNDDSTCAECAAGTLLSKNLCKAPRAANCLTVKEDTACATCPQGYGLSINGDVTDCVINKDTYCTEFTQPAPFICTTCIASYFPDSNGKCKKQLNVITNCDVYDNALECRKCVQGYALTSNKSKCTNSSDYTAFISSTCANSAIVDIPECTQCAAGHVFDSKGVCTPTCQTGCQYCDPNKPAVCILCAFGYFMETKGNCVQEVVDDSGVKEAARRVGLGFVFAIMVVNLLMK